MNISASPLATRKFSDDRRPANNSQAPSDSGVARHRRTQTPLILIPPHPSPSLTPRKCYSQSPLIQQAFRETEERRILEELQEAERRAGTKNVMRVLPHANDNWKAWRYLSSAEKEHLSLRAVEIAGARVFRSTFSPEKEAELRKAAKDGRDIRQMIADAIAHQFRRRGLSIPAFGFVIEEATATYRLHIHGVYLSDPAIPASVVRECFTHAAGKIAGQEGSTQFWHEAGQSLPRYFDYARKGERAVMRRLGLPGVTFINNGLKRLGADLHASQRPGAADEPADSGTSAPPTAFDKLLALEGIPVRVLPLRFDGTETEEELEQLLADLLAAIAEEALPTPTTLRNGREGTAMTRRWFPLSCTARPTKRVHWRRMSHGGRVPPRNNSPPPRIGHSILTNYLFLFSFLSFLH